MIRAFAIALLVWLACISPASAEDRPRITVAEDDFPTGQETPEGAAADLARAFIEGDAERFLRICLPPVGQGEGRDLYETFLRQTAEQIRVEAKREDQSPRGPKQLGKVFAARRLSKNGPASFGYAAYNFQEVKFVDVGTFLHDGSRYLNRTLMIQNDDRRWYALPMPNAYPLLSMGLNDEDDSKTDFAEVYEVVREEKPARPVE